MIKKDYYILGSLLCIYGKNQYLDIILIFIITFILIKNLKRDEFDCFYFGMLFFEPILDLPIVGGSYFKIYQLIFVFKILLEIKNGKAKIRINNIVIISAFILILTGMRYSSFIEEISLVVNIFIMAYIICKKRENNNFYNILIYTIGLFVTFTAVYGFFRGNLLSYGKFNRMSTTISDPNYSALFLNIGIFCILGNKLFGKKEMLVCIIINIISLVLTVSLTGIIGAIIFINIYLYMRKPSKWIKFCSVLLIGVLIFINIPIKEGNALYGIQYRLIKISDSSAEEISSGRTKIAKKYLDIYKKLPIANILFGGYNTISGNFRNKMVQDIGNVSHNSYIDMLYMVGIVGTFLIMLVWIYEIYILFKRRKKDYININYLLIKLIILYFAVTISIFPYRYFLVCYLLYNGGNDNENTLDS